MPDPTFLAAIKLAKVISAKVEYFLATHPLTCSLSLVTIKLGLRRPKVAYLGDPTGFGSLKSSVYNPFEESLRRSDERLRRLTQESMRQSNERLRESIRRSEERLRRLNEESTRRSDERIRHLTEESIRHHDEFLRRLNEQGQEGLRRLDEELRRDKWRY